MELDDATVDDEAAIREVHARSIRELGLEAYDREQVEAWAAGCRSADYASAIESDDSEFVAAKIDGEVVAFGSLSFDPSEGGDADADAEVTAVYVDPSVARRGVGSAVYAELERRARDRGIRSLALSASLNAVPFYEGRGYERVREYAHEFSSHESTGVTGTVIEMRKRL